MIMEDCCNYCDDINEIIKREANLKREHVDINSKYVWEKLPATYDDSVSFRFRKIYKPEW